MLLSTLTLLASSALLATAFPINNQPRQSTTCATGVNIIHARGSTESPAEDETLSVVERLLAAIPGSIETDVDYPAEIISEDSFYSTSVAEGIDDLKEKIRAYVDACGDEARIVLLGYSQGGNVVSSALAGGIVRPIPLDPSYKSYSKKIDLFPTLREQFLNSCPNSQGSGRLRRSHARSRPILQRRRRRRLRYLQARLAELAHPAVLFGRLP